MFVGSSVTAVTPPAVTAPVSGSVTALTVASAAAPDPVPPIVPEPTLVMVTVGAVVYPDPGSVTVKPVMTPVTRSTWAAAVACVPPATSGAPRVTTASAIRSGLLA